MTDQPRVIAFLLLLLAIGFSTTGELFLKKGITLAGGFEFSLPGLVRTFTTWQVLAGFVLFFTGALVWLKVLSLVDLSWAYPMLALGYPIVVLGSLVFLGEPVSLQRVLGSLLILAGVYVMYRSWGS